MTALASPPPAPHLSPPPVLSHPSAAPPPQQTTTTTTRSHSSLAPSTDDDGDSFISDAPHDTLNSFIIHPKSATGPGGPSTSNSAQQQQQALAPSGPICQFGSRLAYTYFPHPAPKPAVLNALTEGSGGGGGTRGEGGEEGGVHWFTIDDQLQYLSFFQDYGPLNTGCLYRFCLHLHSLLTSPQHAHQKIFLYSSDEPDKKVNAAVLMGCYAMVVMRWSVADVLHPLSELELQPYRDAGYSRADYHLHPQSLFYGLHRAVTLTTPPLLDLSTFDLIAYELAEKVETGDWNWITPGFCAFASPVEGGWREGMEKSGRVGRSFRNVVEEFVGKGVRVVVRLNKKLYHPAHFTDRGIEHVEMYFDDGTNPTMEIVREFIDLSDRVIMGGGAVAVHCKAGLGRTGTLIGAYLIYKYGFTADEAIGFMRLMRPGSCVGPQQHFLYENQLEWVRWAARDQLRAELAAANLPHSVVGAGAGTAATVGGAGEEEAVRGVRSTTPNAGRGGEGGERMPPTTPKRQPAVPGQPRKTPGKGRHGVAAPEAVPGGTSPEHEAAAASADEAEEEAQREEERMEGVVLTHSPRKSRGSLGTAGEGFGAGSPGKGRRVMLSHAGAEKEEEEEEDELAMHPVAASPVKLLGPGAAGGLAPAAPIASSSRSLRGPASTPAPAASHSTTTSTTSRPTRIARPAPGSTSTSHTSTTSTGRPLSALADNRIVPTRSSTRAGSSSSAAAAAGQSGTLARSRAAKNLNTVFETAPTTTATSRYPLRNGRTLSAGSPAAAGVPASLVDVPASPTKLPQRVLGKRGAVAAASVSSTSSSTSTRSGSGGFDPAAAAAAAAGTGAAGGGKGGIGGRNVRRRRSSMGSQEFTQAG